jgi:predicted regulator of Ras-like GTPase activity (Roadblock/LC7/MglB family)
MSKIRRKSRGPVTTERRKTRSEVPQEAARLYLEALAQRNNIRAAALAAEDGLLVAGTEGTYDLAGLAALGAACANGGGSDEHTDALMDKVVKDDDLYASSVPVGDETFYLATVGARVRSIKDTGAALARILSTAIPASTRSS